MAIIGTAKYAFGTPIVWAGADYAPTQGQPAKTSGLDLTLSGLPASGAAQQGDKHDIGSDSLDLEYLLRIYCEFQGAAPAAGGAVHVYLGWSDNAIFGTNNPAGLSGADGRYYGYGGTLAEGTQGLSQLQYVGPLICSPHTAVQVQDIGVVAPGGRYVMPVLVNSSTQPLAAINGFESALSMTPRAIQTEN